MIRSEKEQWTKRAGGKLRDIISEEYGFNLLFDRD